jgi:hypothetical protein
MNPDLHTIIDRLTFAPLEVKCEILSILFSEGCIKPKGAKAWLAQRFIKIVILIIGKEKVKTILKNDYLKNSDLAERTFFDLLDALVIKEQLTLIQDVLYAVYLSKWQYSKEDVAAYIDKFNFINLNDPFKK